MRKRKREVGEERYREGGRGEEVEEGGEKMGGRGGEGGIRSGGDVGR